MVSFYGDGGNNRTYCTGGPGPRRLWWPAGRAAPRLRLQTQSGEERGRLVTALTNGLVSFKWQQGACGCKRRGSPSPSLMSPAASWAELQLVTQLRGQAAVLFPQYVTLATASWHASVKLGFRARRPFETLQQHRVKSKQRLMCITFRSLLANHFTFSFFLAARCSGSLFFGTLLENRANGFVYLHVN